MRAYRLADDDENYSRVVPISSAPRARAQAAEQQAPRREPWTPRTDDIVPVARRIEPHPAPLARPTRFSAMHATMLVAFFGICLVMVVSMLVWRFVGDSGSRASASSGQPAAVQAPAAQPVEVAPEPAAPGAGPVSTEIHVLQANYSVSPGDTLATIARRHNTSVDAIASINSLENRNSLSVGQRLVIPQP